MKHKQQHSRQNTSAVAPALETLESRQMMSAWSSNIDIPVTLGDFNGNGTVDVADFTRSAIHILIGQGDGTFTASRTIDLSGIPGHPQALATGDFNGDAI